MQKFRYTAFARPETEICYVVYYTYEETDDWYYVLQRLAGKRVEPDRLITYLFSYGELQQGLEIMRDRREEYVKIMVKYSIGEYFSR